MGNKRQKHTLFNTSISHNKKGNKSISIIKKNANDRYTALIQRLEGSRFREQNEKQYEIESKEAYNQYNKDPEQFKEYHQGYKQQVKNWPENPQNRQIEYINKKVPKEWIQGDFGCGEAELSQKVQNKVYSFDQVSINDRVIACDMAHVPLQDEILDMAIFCLSQMGTNTQDFQREAYRVLKFDGKLKIVEVRSRLVDQKNTGIPIEQREKDGLKTFIKAIEFIGFEHINSQSFGNQMFIWIDFVKIKSKKPSINDTIHETDHRLQKTCRYKKR